MTFCHLLDSKILALSYLLKSNYGTCSALAFLFDVIFVIIHTNKGSEFYLLYRLLSLLYVFFLLHVLASAVQN